MIKKHTSKTAKSIDVYMDGSAATFALYRQLFFPTRLKVLGKIHELREVPINELMSELGLTLKATETTLQILEELKFISVENAANPGHGRIRVAKSLFPPNTEELSIRLILQHLNTVKST